MITKNKTWLETNGHSLSELLSPDTLDRFASELEKIKKHVRAFSDDEALRLALAITKPFEQFFPNPYICPAGKRTVGYGHVIRGGEPPFPWTEPQAAEILLNEFIQTYAPKAKLAWNARKDRKFRTEEWDDLPSNIQAALMSAVYNCGPGIISRGSWVAKPGIQGATSFYSWSRGGGKRLAGLVRRRFCEWKLATTGEIDLEPAGWREWYNAHP